MPKDLYTSIFSLLSSPVPHHSPHPTPSYQDPRPPRRESTPALASRPCQDPHWWRRGAVLDLSRPQHGSRLHRPLQAGREEEEDGRDLCTGEGEEGPVHQPPCLRRRRLGLLVVRWPVGGDEQWVDTGEEDETTSTRDRRRQVRNDEAGKRV